MSSSDSHPTPKQREGCPATQHGALLSEIEAVRAAALAADFKGYQDFVGPARSPAADPIDGQLGGVSIHPDVFLSFYGVEVQAHERKERGPQEHGAGHAGDFVANRLQLNPTIAACEANTGPVDGVLLHGSVDIGAAGVKTDRENPRRDNR